jgi:hypothetical protein
MSDALEFVSLYIILLGIWTYLGVMFSLLIISLRERYRKSMPRVRLPEMGWPDANCFFPWRLWQ